MTNLNYSNQNLQNTSFKGQDLVGADFSGSDLRGCNFTRATLIGANFQKVTTGQSSHQVNMLVASAIVSPIILFGSSMICAQLLTILLSDRVMKLLFGVLPILAFLAEIFIRDSITFNFPQITNFFGIGAIAGLFAVMVSFTIGLAFVSFSSFGDGGAIQGLFLLVLMIISALITHRIFKWLIQSLHSHPGTSFRKANLIDTDFSHSEMQNTDFSFAVLTGACVFKWVIKTHTQFTNVHCQYLYLQPAQQNRQPAEGNFQPGDLGRVLNQFLE